MDRSIIILILLLNSGKPSVSEPVCSKFHYEEQTLEKIIRQEIKVEKMKADIEQTEKRVIDALEDLKMERIEFSKDISKKEEDIERRLRDTMNKDLNRMNSEFNVTIDGYSKEIQKITASAIPPMIAFKADNVKDKSLSKGKVIVFSNVNLNIGDAYNSKDGVFTAPVTGLYLFTAQLCIGRIYWTHFGIVVNGKAVSKTGIGEREWAKCYTMDAITMVEKGVDVYVTCTGDCSGDKLYTDDYSYYSSSFSGALLHKNI